MPIDTKSSMPQPVTVTFKDGHTETLLIQQLSLIARYKFLTLVATDATPEVVALCTGKPLAWLDTLDDESDSYIDLVKVCYQLNFHKALKLAKNDPVIGAKVMPLLGRLSDSLDIAAARGINIEPGANGSPSEQPPAESAVETLSTSGVSAQTP